MALPLLPQELTTNEGLFRIRARQRCHKMLWNSVNARTRCTRQCHSFQEPLFERRDAFHCLERSVTLEADE